MWLRVASCLAAILIGSCAKGTSPAPSPAQEDRRLSWPLREDTLPQALPNESPLVAFACRRVHQSKATNGVLEVSFVPRTAEDAVFHIAWRAGEGTVAPCLEEDLRVTAGRLDDVLLSRAYRYRCRRSPATPFAVSCGPYLAADVHQIVRGNGSGRTVHFRFPWTYDNRLRDPKRCALPFDAGQVHGEELIFDLAEALSAAVAARSHDSSHLNH